MLVSIIIPVYNVEAYLGECLDSVLKQTHHDLEVLVVNDGSSDGSLAVAQTYAQADPRVRIIDKPNGGLSDARNAGIAAATGDFLAFIDGDDYISPDFVAQLLAPLKDATIAVSVCAYFLTSEAGDDYEICHVDPASRISGRELLKRMLQRDSGWHYVIACNKLYRREVFATTRFEVGRHYEDDFISAPLFNALPAVAVIDQPLYHYVQRTGSIMKSALTDVKAADYLDLCLGKIAFFEAHEDPELVNATKRKLIEWILDEPTRRGQALTAPMQRRIQQVFRQVFATALYPDETRFRVLGMIGRVDLRLLSGFRKVLAPVKHLAGH